MKKEYLLMVVINDLKVFRNVRNELKKLGCKRYTVIDTMGGSELLKVYKSKTAFTASTGDNNETKYNKTIIIVLPNKEEVDNIMDGIAKAMNLEINKPGKGIMFTIPIIKSGGIRKEQ